MPNGRITSPISRELYWYFEPSVLADVYVIKNENANKRPKEIYITFI